MRQEYNQDDLQSILDKYNSKGKIKKFHIFKSGFENSNYFTETDQGLYVVKIYEGMGMSQNSIKFEVRVMETSFNAGIKTPHVYKNKDEQLTTEFKGKLAIVMDYIEGENMDKREISDKLVEQTGKETGKMDQAFKVYKDGLLTRQQYEFDAKNFLILEDRIKYLSENFDQDIFKRIFNKFHEIKTELQNLPKGLIHNDVALHNILAKDDKLTAIIDFSDMAFSPYIQNIAVPMCQMLFTYNWQPHQAKIFIKAYKKHHPLSDEELAFLYDVTLIRFVVLILELNYWNVKFGEDKQRTDFIHDNYIFLKKFLAIGHDDFNKLIF